MKHQKALVWIQETMVIEGVKRKRDNMDMEKLNLNADSYITATNLRLGLVDWSLANEVHNNNLVVQKGILNGLSR